MSTSDPGLLSRVPSGVTPLNLTEGEDAALGNLVFLVPEPAPAVLKVFRRRRPLPKELLGQLGHRLIEGKRGVSARERHETERLSLELWHREGFAVPQLLDRPAPDWTGSLPVLWLEHIPGPILFYEVEDPQRPRAETDPLVRALGADHQRRHRRAQELSEPLLLQEHPTTKHVIVDGERLVTFDLEGGYKPGYDILTGIAQELSSTLRSLWIDGDFPASSAATFVEGYGDEGLLREACELFLADTWRWRLKRRSDERRRQGRRTKSGAMRELRALLG